MKGEGGKEEEKRRKKTVGMAIGSLRYMCQEVVRWSVSDGPRWGISVAGMTDGGKERDRHKKRKEREGEA